MEWLRPKIFGSDHVLSVSNLLVTSRNLSVASHKSKSQRFAGSRQHDLNEVTAEQRPCKLLAVGPNHRFDSNARAAPTTHCDAGNTVFNHIFLRPMISVPKCSQVLWMPLVGGLSSPPPAPHTRDVPRTRLADDSPAASFTSFFGLGFLLFFCGLGLPHLLVPSWYIFQNEI